MYLVVAHSWLQAEEEIARTIADTMDLLTLEARQKIVMGGPVVLTSFADLTQANHLAQRLSQCEIPTLVIDPKVARSEKLHQVDRFSIGENSLQFETVSGESGEIDYTTIELLLVATCAAGQTQTTKIVTERKFSLGKTILAGGVPMTKRVKHEKTVNNTERDKTLWLFAKDQTPIIFNQHRLNFEGLAEARKITRNLNFQFLKGELRRLAPQAIYDLRLLSRSNQTKLLGPTFDPEIDLDLAFAILAQSLRAQTAEAGSCNQEYGTAP
jgi:hypothetical protein